MAKQITFEFEGKPYTLEFNRRAIETLEQRGFVIENISTKPMTTLPLLFQSAFMAHHPGIKRALIDKIYDGLENKQGLLMMLAEMYNEPLEALMDDEGKNVTWEKNW